MVAAAKKSPVAVKVSAGPKKAAVAAKKAVKAAAPVAKKALGPLPTKPTASAPKTAPVTTKPAAVKVRRYMMRERST